MRLLGENPILMRLHELEGLEAEGTGTSRGQDSSMGQLEEDLIRHLQVEKATRTADEAEKKASHAWQARLGAVGVLLALAFKFKAVLLLGLSKITYVLGGLKFLSMGKFLTTGGSMLLSVFAYATVFGLPYAVGFVLLIFVHEMGHVVALRWYGVSSSVPIFVPFVGAFVALKEMPKNVFVEAVVGIAGPALGTLGALACLGGYHLTGNPLWLALANVGFFLNLLNLLPVLPLDGGRVVAAVSRWLWIAGLIAVVGLMVVRPNIILILLIVMSVPRLLSTFGGVESDQDYYRVSPSQRFWMGCAYFGLAAYLALGMADTHELLQALPAMQGR